MFGVFIGFIGLWPLFGFVRQRRYNPRWLWLAVFGITAIATLGVVTICLYVAVANLAITPLVVGLATLLWGTPYVFALHQYLFRSSHLWQ